MNLKLKLSCIEHPKFNKELGELTELQDKWICFIKNAGKLDFVPQEIDENIQESSIELAKEQGHDAGRLQGHQTGLEQGLEQGLEKGRIESQKKCY